MRVGDDGVHHAVAGEWRLPRKGLVDADRFAGIVHDEVFPGRAGNQAAGRPSACRPRPYQACRPASVQRGGPRKWRLVAEAARHIDAADQHLHQVQRAAGMEPIRMRGDAPHRVEGDRTPDHTFLAAAGPIRPRLLDHHLFLERDMRDFGCKSADRLRRDTGPAGDWRASILRGDNVRPEYERQASRPDRPASVCSPFIAGDTSARSALASAFDC